MCLLINVINPTLCYSKQSVIVQHSCALMPLRHQDKHPYFTLLRYHLIDFITERLYVLLLSRAESATISQDLRTFFKISVEFYHLLNQVD